jgi:hypothetical protein
MGMTQRVSSRATLAFTAVLVTIYVVGLLLFMENSTYDTWGGLLLAPILILVSLPILARQAAREGSRSLFWLLVAALLVKLVAALIFHFVAYDLYDRVADAVGYHEGGVSLAERFRAGNYNTGFDSLHSVNFMKLLAGILYTVIGPTKFGGYLFFSWLGFWGLFLFYRAFTIAVPEGKARGYARLIFFLPSLAFWPSSIGKEAWMMLALGIAAFGAARALNGRTWSGLTVVGLGLWMTTPVRPHITALMGVSLAVAYALRPSRQELGHLAPVAKALSMAVVAIIAVVVVVRAERFLRDVGIETERGVAGAQRSVVATAAGGGSDFVPSILESPTQIPKAVLTVLFRPHPLEAHNTQAFLASMEGMFLLLFTLVRIPWGLAALRKIRRRPYVALSLVYTVIFIVAFSSLSNFGLLVRQRVQVLPFYLALLCIPPARKDISSRPADDSSRWQAAA